MLGSANLGPSAFFSFYYNFVKRGPFATKFCTHSATNNIKNAANLVILQMIYCS